MRFRFAPTLMVFMFVGSPGAIANQPPRDPRFSDLRDIYIALHYMHERLGGWPTSTVDTGPSRSWRVELLNFLDRVDLSKKYRESEPWSSPKNQALVNATPDCYTPYDALDITEYFENAPRPGDTWYLAPVDDKTVWSGKVKRISQIIDGTDQTIVLIEAPEMRIPWTEPRDLNFDEAVELLGKPTRRYHDSWFYVTEYEAPRSVHFANGICSRLQPIAADTAAALLTPYGREPVSIDNLKVLPWRQAPPRTVYKWDRIVPLSLTVCALSAIGLIAIAARKKLLVKKADSLLRTGRGI